MGFGRCECWIEAGRIPNTQTPPLGKTLCTEEFVYSDPPNVALRSTLGTRCRYLRGDLGT